MKKLYFAFSILALSGCATTPSDFSPDLQKQAAVMQALSKDEKPSFEYSIIKQVSSNSCDSKTAARFAGDTDEAVLLLKLETAKIGGNAVVNYSCRTMPVDLVSNCWASKRCEGDAVLKK